MIRFVRCRHGCAQILLGANSLDDPNSGRREPGEQRSEFPWGEQGRTEMNAARDFNQLPGRRLRQLLPIVVGLLVSPSLAWAQPGYGPNGGDSGRFTDPRAGGYPAQPTGMSPAEAQSLQSQRYYGQPQRMEDAAPRSPSKVIPFGQSSRSAPQAQSAQPPAAPGANSRVVDFMNSTPQGDAYIAVLGEVKYPNVYKASGSPLTVAQLLQQAGGLTPRAGATLRLVRRGRPGQRVFLGRDDGMKLESNDIVIVDSVISTAGTDAAANRAGGPGRPDEQLPGVYLALLDVLDRPVVVRVRPDEAYIPVVVQKLAQSPDIAPSVRVIESDRRAGLFAEAAPLSNGSVLKFDRGRLDPRRLPQFQSAIDVKEAAQSAAPQRSEMRGPTASQGERDMSQWNGDRDDRFAPLIDPRNEFPQSGMPPADSPGSPYAMAPVSRPSTGPATLSTEAGNFPQGRPAYSTSFPQFPRMTNEADGSAIIPPPLDIPPEPSSIDASPSMIEPRVAMNSSRSIDRTIDRIDSVADPLEPMVEPIASASTPSGGTLTMVQMMMIVVTVSGLIGLAMLVRHVSEGDPRIAEMRASMSSREMAPRSMSTSMPSTAINDGAIDSSMASHSPMTSDSMSGMMGGGSTMSKPSAMPSAARMDAAASAMASGISRMIEAPAPDALLEALLNNELPMVSEDARPPVNLKLQSMSAIDRAARLDRAVAAETGSSIPRPHFRTRPARPAELREATEMAIESSYRIDAPASEISAPHRAATSDASEGRSALDRALERLQAGAKR